MRYDVVCLTVLDLRTVKEFNNWFMKYAEIRVDRYE